MTDNDEEKLRKEKLREAKQKFNSATSRAVAAMSNLLWEGLKTIVDGEKVYSTVEESTESKKEEWLKNIKDIRTLLLNKNIVLNDTSVLYDNSTDTETIYDEVSNNITSLLNTDIDNSFSVINRCDEIDSSLTNLRTLCQGAISQRSSLVSTDMSESVGTYIYNLFLNFFQQGERSKNESIDSNSFDLKGFYAHCYDKMNVAKICKNTNEFIECLKADESFKNSVVDFNDSFGNFSVSLITCCEKPSGLNACFGNLNGNGNE
jgi:hypothetical protein